jgi:hypothetical protein
LAFENFQLIQPIDEIELAILRAEDVVALDGLFPPATVTIKNFTALF